MFVPLKPDTEYSARPRVDKLVVSAWPQFVADRYAGTVCNVSIAVAVEALSPRPLQGLDLLVESRYLGHRRRIEDITSTLLDPCNPLTYTTQGRYRRDPGSPTLRYYDGLPNVFADCGAQVGFVAEPAGPLARLRIRFADPVERGATRAVRFCFWAPGLFAAADDGALFFNLPFQSDSPLYQFGEPADLQRRQMPIVNVGADGLAGGLDVFFYMPLEYDGEDFSHEPFHSLLPNYDHLGRIVEPPRMKFAWPGVLLKPHPGSPLLLGDNVKLRGRFARRSRMTHNTYVNNGSGNLFAEQVSQSAVGPNATTVVSPDDLATILRSIDAMRRLLDGAEGEPAAELALVHVDQLDEAVRGGRLDVARRHLQPLAEAAKGLLDVAGPVLDLIDRVSHAL